jgi:tetratricopeptide (TPR) repeat protein
MGAMRAKAQLGQTDAANDYLQQTKDTFAAAIKRWPDDLRFTNGLAQVAIQSNDLPTAETVLKTLSDRPHWKDQPAPLILLARVYLAAGKNDLAETALRKALETNPKSVDAHLVLADCLIIQEKYDEALAVLQPAAADFTVRAKYCDLLVAMGRGSQAQVGLEDAIKADPTNAALTNLLLHVYDQQHKWDQGIHAASDAILSDPRNVFAYFWRAKMEASGDAPDLESAIKDLNFFLDSVQNSIEGRVVMSQILDAKRDRDGAIRQLESALQFDPQSREVRLRLLQDYLTAAPPRTIDADRLLTQTLALPTFQHDPEFESQAAMLWAQKGDNDKAVATMQDAMKHAKEKSGLIHNYFAVLLSTKDPRNLQLLLDESQQYVSDPKTSWFVFCDRGAAKAGLGDTDGATSEFAIAMDRAGAQTGRGAATDVANTVSQRLGVDKALAMVLPRSNNSVTWKLISIDLYIAKGDMTAATAMADTALTSADALTPDDRFHLYQLASSLYISAVPPLVDKAVGIYQKMLAVAPNDIEALNDMACVLSDLTVPANPKQALDYSQRAFDLSVKSGRMNPRIYDTQGWVLLLNGRIDEGIDVMHRAIDQADFPEAHYHLAQAYLKKELPEEAQHELASALDMIQTKTDQHLTVDSTLKDKIDMASKQADEMIRVKSTVKAAS